MLERNHNFGGAATVYRHGTLAIEASLHEIDGLDAGDPKGPILRALGIDRDIPFVDVGDLHEVRSPLFEKPFVMPHGFDAALRRHERAFSASKPTASGNISIASTRSGKRFR